MSKFLRKLLNIRMPERKTRGEVKNEEFLKGASFQFKELAKKGLSIPVFTL